jgi:hypothetical protein
MPRDLVVVVAMQPDVTAAGHEPKTIPVKTPVTFSSNSPASAKVNLHRGIVDKYQNNGF